MTIDMTEGEAEYLKYRFKQYLGSVSRAIQNKRLEEQKMGMTIDEIITNLESLRKDYQEFYDEEWQNPETYNINAESLNIAIETMHKYQKIEDIYYHQSGEALENSLRAVIEDGKINRC